MSKYIVYVLDSNFKEERIEGKYHLKPVTDIRQVSDPEEGFPILVMMNARGLPTNLTGIKEWLVNVDINNTHIYLIEGTDTNFHYKSIKGVASLQEGGIDEVHPLYTDIQVSVLDGIEKGNYMSAERIEQAKNNIATTFQYVSVNHAQDVFLLEGEHPTVRVKGELIKSELNVWSLDEFNVFIAIMLGNDLSDGVSEDLYYNKLQETDGTLDVHADIGENNLRCHLYRSFPKHHGQGVRDFNAVTNVRVIPKKMPILEELNLPEIYKIFEKEHGLLLISGRGNDGKSTTVASIVNEFNNMGDKYRIILTIEEPVEFVHKNKNAWVIQRRVGDGADSVNYALATEDAMREDTDIVVIQELRKQEEMHNALRLAEIGKLVISTIHANSVAGTVERFVNEFDGQEHAQIRSRLMDNLLGIIHQNLIVYDGKQYPLVSMLLVVDEDIRQELRTCTTASDIHDLLEQSESTNLLTRSDGFDLLVLNGLVPEDLKSKYVRE